MLDYRLINQLDSACTCAHLVTWPGSTLLAQAPLNAVPLLAEMVEQAARGEVADTRFGCSPSPASPSFRHRCGGDAERWPGRGAAAAMQKSR